MALFDGLTRLANPQRFMSFSKPLLWWSGSITAVLLGIGIVWSLMVDPMGDEMGDSIKIMFVHVPAAWMAVGAYTHMVIASIIGYVWRHQLADLAAKEAAPIGFIFCCLALMTGAIWGKITWGVWWDWDPRMTSVLILAFVYAGYIILWEVIENQAQAARFAALLCFIGAINVPIIKFSVESGQALHQTASVFTNEGPKIRAEMLWPLSIMALAYTALFVFYLTLRLRTALRERTQERQSPARPVSVAQPVTLQDKPLEDDEANNETMKDEKND